MDGPIIIKCDPRKSDAVDYYEMFCEQAGRGRKLSSADEFGGSLPILKYQAVKAARPPLEKTERCNSSDFLSVPAESPHLRRAHSDLGADEHKQLTEDPSKESLIASCKQKLKSKPASLRLWSSFRSLVESCDNPSACLSPESPPYDIQYNASSAPHSRSSSIKKKKNRRPRSQYSADSLDSSSRPRLASMSSKNSVTKAPRQTSTQSSSTKESSLDVDDCFRVRNFITTPQGIINCGDSFRSLSTTSIKSLASSTGHDSFGSVSSLTGETVDCPAYKVHILGSHGVGKTTLAQQFLTSECIVEKQSLREFEEDPDDSTVSVLLNDDESHLVIKEVLFEESNKTSGIVDAYLVVYSINDRTSYHHAMDILFSLRQQPMEDTVIIVVANKSDLVRLREVAEQEGKVTAESYGSKFQEVSALMNLKVDELLAGLVNLIRLNRDRNSPKDGVTLCAEGRASPLRLIGRILRRQAPVSRSCDNLLVL